MKAIILIGLVYVVLQGLLLLGLAGASRLEKVMEKKRDRGGKGASIN